MQFDLFAFDGYANLANNEVEGQIW